MPYIERKWDEEEEIGEIEEMEREEIYLSISFLHFLSLRISSFSPNFLVGRLQASPVLYAKGYCQLATGCDSLIDSDTLILLFKDMHFA